MIGVLQRLFLEKADNVSGSSVTLILVLNFELPNGTLWQKEISMRDLFCASANCLEAKFILSIEWRW